MRYKLFTLLFVSGLLSIPQNSFTCGPSEEPTDYFTSFFSRSVAAGKAYEPFYYTALLPFYDDAIYDAPKPSPANDRILREWMTYTKSSAAAATQLVYTASRADLLALQRSATSGEPLPPALAINAAAKSLVVSKNAAAIGYLAFARQVETVSMSDGWNRKQPDSLQLNRYISQATASFATATDAFLRNKWAFQRCKLAFYNNRFTDCIRFYNEAFNDAIPDAVQQLALSYKGGSEYKLGLNKEAAYSFSKAFPLSAQKKKENYQGFLWATNYADASLLPDYITLCKNNPERANLTALFALYGTAYNIAAIKQVYALNPASALLPLLATREVNKLEEQWLTPNLSKEKGGKALYVNWVDEEEKKKAKSPEPVLTAAGLFEKLMADPAVVHRGVYGAGAAYLHYMLKDYSKARSLVAATKTINTEDKVTDQLSLISLLIIASEGKAITPATEAEMLPAIKWLAEKAKKDNEYAVFCRNFFSQVLAQEYEQQGDGAKAALAYGMSDLRFIAVNKNEYYGSSTAINYVQEDLSTADLLTLNQYTTTPSTEAIKYLVQNGSVKKDNVVDVIGTSYLRDGNYTKAIEWLSKAGKLEPMVESNYNYNTGKELIVNVDPLHDYMNDWQRLDKGAAKPYTKLTLAQKLLELQKKAESPSATDDKAKAYYHLATALYNISYYGNSWSAVAYYRSTYLWNEGVYKQPWEREYFGVYKARALYQKAYETATDKEFKAACLFMVAKCAQRQVVRPTYDYTNDEASDKKQATFEKQFKANPVFARFKAEFGGTKYYQLAYNRCSYLRDYVAGSGGLKAPK